MLQKQDIRRSFNKAANAYDEVAVLQRQVAGEMLDRLELIKSPFNAILDAGCGTGYAINRLSQRYPRAQVVALDLADDMLRYSRRRHSSALSRINPFSKSPLFVCSDIEQLSLKDNCVDLIYSNLTLQWCNDLGMVFGEWMRVLKPGGMLLFSSLGPDTLKELRECWRAVDGGDHVHTFIDMHVVGDALLGAGFAEPVMDVDYYTLTYAGVMDLMRDLKTLGAVNALRHKSKSLTGKSRFQQLADQYEQFRHNERLPATYEVVFGHAWKTEDKRGEIQVNLTGRDSKRG